MKTKLFKLIGSNTEKLGMSNSPYSLMDSNNLSTYVDVITIGDLEVGFEIKDLKTQFAAHLSDGLEPLNILLCMHGENKIDKYFLETHNGVEVECNEVVNALVGATGGRPLKILSVSCYGALFHNYLKFLPPKSLLITLSDKDKESSSCDYHTLNAKALLDVFMKENFSIERLFECYLFNQKYTFNTPVISIVYGDTFKIFSMKDIIKKSFTADNGFTNSTFIDALIDSQIITDEQIDTIRTSLLPHGGNAEHLIPHKSVLSMITQSWKDNNIEDFIKTHEREYYFPGALKNLKLSLENFSESFTPKPLMDFAECNISKFLQLQHYIEKHNLFDNAIVKEERELFYNNNLSENQSNRLAELTKENINKLMSTYRGLKMILDLDSPSSLLMFADENFRIHNERSSNDGEIRLDYTLPVNNTLPQYSVCMGIAFDVWLQNHL